VRGSSSSSSSSMQLLANAGRHTRLLLLCGPCMCKFRDPGTPECRGCAQIPSSALNCSALCRARRCGPQVLPDCGLVARPRPQRWATAGWCPWRATCAGSASNQARRTAGWRWARSRQQRRPCLSACVEARRAVVCCILRCAPHTPHTSTAAGMAGHTRHPTRASAFTPGAAHAPQRKASTSAIAGNGVLHSPHLTHNTGAATSCFTTRALRTAGVRATCHVRACTTRRSASSGRTAKRAGAWASSVPCAGSGACVRGVCSKVLAGAQPPGP
jgi:hypothetical protein